MLKMAQSERPNPAREFQKYRPGRDAARPSSQEETRDWIDDTYYRDRPNSDRQEDGQQK